MTQTMQAPAPIEMTHCQYCNTTEQVEETTLSGPNGDKKEFTCDRCFTSGIMFDIEPLYTPDGEEVQ